MSSIPPESRSMLDVGSATAASPADRTGGRHRGSGPDGAECRDARLRRLPDHARRRSSLWSEASSTSLRVSGMSLGHIFPASSREEVLRQFARLVSPKAGSSGPASPLQRAPLRRLPAALRFLHDAEVERDEWRCGGALDVEQCDAPREARFYHSEFRSIASSPAEHREPGWWSTTRPAQAGDGASREFSLCFRAGQHHASAQQTS